MQRKTGYVNWGAILAVLLGLLFWLAVGIYLGDCCIKDGV